MVDFKVLSTADGEEWDFAINCLPYGMRDIHYTAGWYRAHEHPGHVGKLAVMADHAAGYLVCQPFMMREIPGTLFSDMTTAGGFGGRLTSTTLPSPVDGHYFEDFMRKWRRDQSVVSEFYLINPTLVPLQVMMEAGGTDLFAEREVFLMHLGTDEEIEGRLTKGRKHSVSRLKEPRLIPTMEPVEFENLYNASMDRKEASARWRFPAGHFQNMRDNLGSRLAFIGAQNAEGEIKAAALFARGDSVCHYLLSCTAEDRLSGYADLCILSGATAARAAGCEWLYLGGGLSDDASDPLAFYKRSFGAIPRLLYSARKVHMPNVYDGLSGDADRLGSFPAYRQTEFSK